ncbi:MAG: hypothetical protein ACFCVK_12495 [Acidimicrobiales bacterium]
MEYGIDPADPFGVGALFVAQSMGHRFDCQPLVAFVMDALVDLPTPQLPNEPVTEVLRPVDRLLDRFEREPGALELVAALAELATTTPARTEVAERLHRAVLWVAARAELDGWRAQVLQLVRDTTPGARFQDRHWPRHGFFSAVVLLVYLGGPTVRRELTELLAAARDLNYDDLAPVLEWHLDHVHRVPARL